MTTPPRCPADNCPECLDGPVTPYTSRSGEVWIVGAYRCPGCGHTWMCSWRIESLGQQEVNGDAA